MHVLNQDLHVALADPAIEKVLLSQEDFTVGGQRHCRSAEELVPRRNATLERLSQLLSGFDVTMVLVLRRQDSLIKSLYNSLVGYHLVTASLEEIQNHYKSLLYFDTLLDQVAGLFGRENIRILFFEDLKEDSFAFTDRFLQLSVPDLSLDRSSTLTPLNASLSPDAFRIMHYANGILRKRYNIGDDLMAWRIPETCDLERDALQRTLINLQRQPGDVYDYECDACCQRDYLATFQESNQRLFEVYVPNNSPDQRWCDYYTGQGDPSSCSGNTRDSVLVLCSPARSVISNNTDCLALATPTLPAIQ